MKTTRILSLVLFIVLMGMLVQVVQADIEVGVSMGDWVRYEAKDASGTGEIFMQISTVQDTNVGFKLFLTASNGTQTSHTMSGEIGKSNLNAFIIPANLNVGDSFQEATYVTNITGIEERVVGGESRQVVFGPVERMGFLMVYWDRITGLMIEASNVKIVDTNAWLITSRPFTFPVSVEDNSFLLSGNSSSNISDLIFVEELKEVQFTVQEESQTTGFCDIAIPNDLIWGELTVYNDDDMLTEDVDYTQSSNGTHNILQITYNQGTHIIEIQGTEAIPEFPSFIILPVLTLTTLASAIIFKRRRYSQFL